MPILSSWKAQANRQRAIGSESPGFFVQEMIEGSYELEAGEQRALLHNIKARRHQMRTDVEDEIDSVALLLDFSDDINTAVVGPSAACGLKQYQQKTDEQ